MKSKAFSDKQFDEVLEMRNGNDRRGDDFGSRRGGDRGGFGGDRRGGFRNDFGSRPFSGPREMHDAVCAECGNACKVPFKPREGGTVYCRECFAKRRSAGRPLMEKREDARSSVVKATQEAVSLKAAVTRQKKAAGKKKSGSKGKK